MYAEVAAKCCVVVHHGSEARTTLGDPVDCHCCSIPFLR
jgi:hypothetical protein